MTCHPRSVAPLLPLLLFATTACRETPPAEAKSGAGAALAAPPKPAPEVTLGSLTAAPPPTPADTADPPATSDSAGRAAAPADSAKPKAIAPPWAVSVQKDAMSPAPVKTGRYPAWPALPEPLPGSLLPGTRLIAYYGNPLSKRMGILGEIPVPEMLQRLERQAAEWRKADTTVKTMPAFELIATVAQASAGKDGKYRLRMSDSTIAGLARHAEERGWPVILDVQVGHSDVESEVKRLLPFLRKPGYHLGIDAEFAMARKGYKKPGSVIGSLDAKDINVAIRILRDVVEQEKLPPKVLVIHRFTQGMLTNYKDLIIDPRVQLVVHMDGFGAPWLKYDSWRAYVLREPVQYTGFKLFFKNDKPLLGPSQVLKLDPKPLVITYQ